MAILKADVTVSAAERQRILKPETEGERADRLVRLGECANRLAMSRRSVSNLLASGALPSVRLPGRKRVIGTRESALRALIEGRAAE
jgi:predicted DNA-binding transcriptional regulator AlpA